MWLKIIQFARIRKIVTKSSWSKIDWIYNNKNNFSSAIASRNGANSSNFSHFRFTKILSSVYAAQSEDLQEVPLLTPTNHCFQIANSYVEGHTLSEAKKILWPKRCLHYRQKLQ